MSESDTDSLSGLSSRELEEDSNSDEEDDHVDPGDSVMEAEFNVNEPVLPVTLYKHQLIRFCRLEAVVQTWMKKVTMVIM